MTPILLDVTRTLRTTRENATGIDRVERAYIRHLPKTARPLLFLGGYRGGCAIFRAEDARLLLDGKIVNDRSKLKQSVRFFRYPQFWDSAPIWAGSYWRLSKELSRQLPRGFHYVNVGHTHLTSPLFRRLRSGGAKTASVLLHDTIPLDRPGLQTAKSVRRFRRRFDAATKNADQIIANSAYTAERVRHWSGRSAAKLPIRVAHLGVDPAPDGPPVTSSTPYFVQLGTIEPRKNHEMILDIWDSFGDQPNIPHLHIIGRWGWMAEALKERLRTNGQLNRSIFHHEFMGDEEVAAYIRGAQALLFPSLVEGFGYPLFEAMQMNTPVICPPLPAFKELAPEGPLYTESRDVKAWAQQIKRLADAGSDKIDFSTKVRIPRWDEHFEWVNTLS